MTTFDSGKQRIAPPNACAQESVFVFGGIQLRFTTASSVLMDLVSQRYPVTAENSKTTTEIHVNFALTQDAPQGPNALFEGRKGPLSFRWKPNGSWDLKGRDFSASFEAKQRRLKLDGPLAIYPLDLACLVLWYTQHPDGLIVHGAGLRFDQDYWLCSGPSGVGKTTLTQLFPKQALCDEFCGVLTQTQPNLVSLPFWKSKPDSGRLARIFLLEHSLQNKISTLPVEVRFRELSAQVFWPYFDETLTQRALENLNQLIQKISVQRLAFRPTTDVSVLFRSQEVIHA